MTIRIRVPSSLLVSNLIGVAGLLAVLAAVGLLAGWAWALLGAGVIAVGLCALAQNARPAEPAVVDRGRQLLHEPVTRPSPAPAGAPPAYNGAPFQPAREFARAGTPE